MPSSDSHTATSSIDPARRDAVVAQYHRERAAEERRVQLVGHYLRQAQASGDRDSEQLLAMLHTSVPGDPRDLRWQCRIHPQGMASGAEGYCTVRDRAVLPVLLESHAPRLSKQPRPLSPAAAQVVRLCRTRGMTDFIHPRGVPQTMRRLHQLRAADLPDFEVRVLDVLFCMWSARHSRQGAEILKQTADRFPALMAAFEHLMREYERGNTDLFP